MSKVYEVITGQIVEQLERERDEAIKRGWKAAHDCIAYCVANWQQDARTETQQASLAVISEYLADMRRESPDEYLAIEWRGVEARAASEARVKVLEAALKPFAAEIERRAHLVHGPDLDDWNIGGNALTYGDLRRARAIMEKPDA